MERLKVKVTDGSYKYTLRKKDIDEAIQAVAKLLKLSNEITDGKLITHEAEPVENWLCDETGLKNPMVAADGLLVKPQYEEFKELLKAKEIDLVQVFDGVPNVSNEVLNEIEESCNVYLDKEGEEVFYKLEELAIPIIEYAKKYPFVKEMLPGIIGRNEKSSPTLYNQTFSRLYNHFKYMRHETAAKKELADIRRKQEI